MSTSEKTSTKRWPPVTKDRPCPICGGDHWCAVSIDGNWCRCQRESGPNGEAKKDYWLHWVGQSPKPTSGSRRPQRRNNRPVQPSGNGHAAASGQRTTNGQPKPSCGGADATRMVPASPDLLSEAYGRLLNLCPLSDADRSALLARGLLAEAIERAGYGSMPSAEFAERIGSLMFAWLGATGRGKDYVRIPGLVDWDGKRIASPPGLLIPVRNLSGQIIAIRVRPYDPSGSGDGGKYRVLSSATKDHPEQPSPGSPAHVPLGVTSPAFTVRITEGELKAEIATIKTGIPTIAFPGVNSWNVVLPVLESLETNTVLVAFDADASANHNVAARLRECVEELKAKGFDVQIEVWDAAHSKGIDDLLAAGEQPTVLAGDDLTAAVADICAAAEKAKAEKDAARAAEREGEAAAKAADDADLATAIKEGLAQALGASGPISLFENADLLWDLAKLSVLDPPAFGACRVIMDAAGVKRRDFDKAVKPLIEKAVSEAQAEQSDAESEDPGIIKLLADSITADNHFAQDAGCKLFRYVDGVYRPKAERYIAQQVKSLLQRWGNTKLWSSKCADEVTRYIAVDVAELWERPPADVINVQNGLLDLATGSLAPHSPDFLSPIQLPVAFDPDAQCPAIEKFVGEVFPADAVDLAWELPGWLMVPDTSIQQAVLLLGNGGNGKSRYLAMVRSFVGKKNACSFSLHRLELDKYSTARIEGKLANICPDLPSADLDSVSIFKAITGGDSIVGENKFGTSFDFVPFCRLIFSANHPPKSKDSSEGFFRRWLCIPFGRIFESDDPARIESVELDRRLSQPAELSGLLNRAIEGYRRLKTNRGFSMPKSAAVAADEFRQATDHFSIWFEKNVIDDPDSWVYCADLRNAYNAAAGLAGQPAKTETPFGVAIKRIRPNTDKGQKGIGRKWAYLGIGLKAADKASGGQQADSLGSLSSLSSPHIIKSRTEEVNDQTGGLFD